MVALRKKEQYCEIPSTNGKKERITSGREGKSEKKKIERCDVTSGDKMQNHK